MTTKSVKADVAGVRSIVAPEWTETWHPVSHAQVMDAVELSLDSQGIAVRDRNFTLASKGNRCFASYTLDVAKNGTLYQLGWRNAIDKAFAVGFAAGTLVTVCSNLMFKGEFMEFRKHTNGLDWYTLLALAKETTKKVIGEIDSLIDWQNDLKTITLRPDEYKVLTFNAMEAGAVAPSKFSAFNKAYEEEVNINGDSLYAFHGAGTRVMRGNGLFTVADKSKALNGVVDQFRDLKQATGGAYATIV